MSNNLLKRINPTIKLVGWFIIILSFFFPFHKTLFIYELTVMFGVVLLSNIPFKDLLYVINKIKFILLLIVVILFRIKNDKIMVLLYSIKIVDIILYFYATCKSYTIYDISKSTTKIIDVFNFLNLNMKKLNNKIYLSLQYLNIGYNYYKEYIVLNSLKGFDYGYKGIFYKIKFPFKVYKQLKKDCNNKIKELEDSMKYRNYSFNKDVYKYNKKLLICDYLYLLLHLTIVFIYVWRVRV